jgi:diguanylate cyclase (GGDEF)-like protein
MNRGRLRALRRKPSGDKRVRARAAPRESEVAPAKSKTGAKPQALPMRLAAELDALKEELAKARSRVAELESRVDEDPLTGLLNRRGFERAFERALAYVQRYGATAALLFLDLDGFKAVNDRYGHAAGDWALGRIARLISGHVRASDVVARIGGDEFVVLLWNMRDADAAAKAAALEAAVYATPLRRGASTLVVGASAGVAFIGPLDTPAEVLARADAAMYARKAERRERHLAFGGA